MKIFTPFFSHYFFLFALLVFIETTSYSQNNNFKIYGLSEGLSNSNVYSVLQDKRGYIWVGTGGGGVNKFSGSQFKNYTTKDGFSGNSIRCMMEDSKGRIWFGTDGGITVYDGLSFQSITIKDSLKGSNVLSLLEDKSGIIWAGTDDGGINKIDLNADEIVQGVLDQSNGLTSNSIFDIYEDEYNRIWLATLYGGINILTIVNDSVKVEALRGGDELPSGMILTLERDLDGNIWCGTYDVGAFQIKPSKNNPSEWQVVTFPGINSSAIWDIYCRKNGEVWLATGDKGIIRSFPDKENKTWSAVNYTAKEGLPSNQLLCMEEDMEGNMWIGTNGEGICEFLGDRFAHYNKSSGFSNNNITDVIWDGKTGFWLTTDGGGLDYFIQDDKGKIQTKIFDVKDGLPSNYLTAVSQGKTDNNPYLWIGTTNKGITKFDGKKFTSFTTDDGLLENRINDVFVDDNGIVWIATATGISKWDGKEFINVTMEDMLISSDGVNCIIEDENNNIWIGTSGALAKYNRNGNLQTFDREEGLNHVNVNCLAEDKNGNIWIGTKGGGIYYFEVNSNEKKSIRQVVNDAVLNSNTIYSMAFVEDTILVVGSDKGMDKLTVDLNGKVNTIKNYNVSDGFFNVECNANAITKVGTQVWMGTGKGLTRYDWTKEPKAIKPPLVHISEIKLFFKSVNWEEKSNNIVPWFKIPENLELSYEENHITFYFNGIYTTNSEKLFYKYKLEGQDDEWSPIDKESKVTYSGLNHGNYTFIVKAVNADGIWSDEAKFSFTITPPWYKTIWFYILSALFVLVSFILYTKFREQRLKNEKKILEQKVYDRTQEIRQQKEHIEEKNIEIMDSINYAKRIQTALLTGDSEWEKISKDYFVFFKPKDVVSGDFFWAFHNEISNLSIWVAADCTGHGVPGAFMSMLGMGFLNEIIIENNVTESSEILNLLREKIINALIQKDSDSQQKDGMDIALCVWDKKKNIIDYSGANNPLWVVRDLDKILPERLESRKTMINEENTKAIIEIAADKQPVGLYGDELAPFTSKKIKLEQGDTVYTFSDGFPDQFGGPKGKKFMYKPFKRLLLEVNNRSLEEQKEIITKSFYEWKGDLEQIDDICIIGVRV